MKKDINQMLKELNAISNEIAFSFPEMEEETKRFKNSIELHYWKNNQLTLF